MIITEIIACLNPKYSIDNSCHRVSSLKFAKRLGYYEPRFISILRIWQYIRIIAILFEIHRKAFFHAFSKLIEIKIPALRLSISYQNNPSLRYSPAGLERCGLCMQLS